MKENEMTPNLLKNWTIETLWDGSVVLHGEIYNDTKKRFKDGTHIRTSRLRCIDFEVDEAETMNTIYVLERKNGVRW